MQKKLCGTVEDLRGQYTEEEDVRNHCGPQRAAYCRISCGKCTLRTSEGSILQKKLWGTTEDSTLQKLWRTTQNLRRMFWFTTSAGIKL